MKKTITILLFFLSLQLSAQCWENISAGYNHSLAVKNDGTLWAWGSNGGGRLGDNTTVSKNIPTQIGTDANWVDVEASFSSSYAIKTDGTLWAWGINADGQLGLGTTTFSYRVPTQVGTDTNWQSISSHDDYCIAIKTDGSLWAWGRNNYGQLGDNTTTNKNAPVQIGTDTDWQSLSNGQSHSLAIKSNGTLWAWGNNANGALGDGTFVNKSVPVQIGTSNNWQKIDAGFGHSLGVKTDGTLWAWGANSNGEYGANSSTSSSSPIQVGGETNWIDVSASQFFSYAVKSNLSVWSTGINTDGQLGNGTTSTTVRRIFSQVGTFTDSDKIATGYFHVLNTNGDGFIRVTGKNDNGQLGNGTISNENTFIYISCYNSVLSNEDFVLNEVKLYPNPVNDVLNITFDNEIKSVSMYNLLGQEVMTKSVNSNDTSLNISDLKSGTYLVKVTSNNEVKTAKIIKN